MAPSPQCSALNAAMQRTGKTYGQIAASTGMSEQHVIDICTGTTTAAHAEYNALAQALGITSPAPHISAHVNA